MYRMILQILKICVTVALGRVHLDRDVVRSFEGLPSMSLSPTSRKPLPLYQRKGGTVLQYELLLTRSSRRRICIRIGVRNKA